MLTRFSAALFLILISFPAPPSIAQGLCKEGCYRWCAANRPTDRCRDDCIGRPSCLSKNAILSKPKCYEWCKKTSQVTMAVPGIATPGNNRWRPHEFTHIGLFDGAAPIGKSPPKRGSSFLPIQSGATARHSFPRLSTPAVFSDAHVPPTGILVRSDKAQIFDRSGEIRTPNPLPPKQVVAWICQSKNVAFPLHVFAVVGCNPLKMHGSKLHRLDHACNTMLDNGNAVSA